MFYHILLKLLYKTGYFVKDGKDFNKVLILIESQSVEASAGELDWILWKYKPNDLFLAACEIRRHTPQNAQKNAIFLDVWYYSCV